MQCDNRLSGTSSTMPNSTFGDRDIVGILAARAKLKDLKGLYGVIEQAGGCERVLQSPEKVKPYSELYFLLQSKNSVKAIQSDLKRWSRQGVKFFAFDSPHYPPLLREIYDPPALLFCRGTVPLVWADYPCLAIVGSRNADRYGLKIGSLMGSAVVSSGGCVVSGLALGIDGSAHRGALEVDSPCPTIAILGSGVDQITPSTHQRLGINILDRGGAIISQFEPGTPPYPPNFLDRNRVIAGISLGVLVVQARARSGALVTARHALNEGREVMAVPGPIDTPRCEGSNALIREGAHLIGKAEDLIEVLPALKRSLSAKLENDTVANPVYANMLQLLRDDGPLHYDELRRRTGEENFQTTLLELELQGEVERLPGNMVAIR